MSRWRLRGIVAAALCALAAGCVYESFEEPVTFLPTNNVATDAGNNTSANNTSANNVTTPDMGTTPDDMGGNNATTPDMGMNTPWVCTRKLLGNGGSSTEIQIEPLDDDQFLVTWPLDLTSARVATVDLDGNIVSETDYSGLVSEEQRIELLTDETVSHHIWLLESAGLKLLDCNDAGCNEATSNVDSVVRVDGFWNGGDQVPHIATYNTDGEIRITADIANEPTVGLTTTANAPAWLSLALTAAPPNPTDTSPFVFGYVDDGTIFTGSRPTSGTPISLTGETCSEQVATAQKVFATGGSQGEIIADIRDAGDSVIAQVDCESGSKNNLTTPLIGLNDWAAIDTPGTVRVFHLTQDGLNMSEYDGQITDVDMEVDAFERVDATQNSNGIIAVVTVDSDGRVEMRTMDSAGTCL